MAAISMSTASALQVLEAWRAQEQLLRQDPEWRDTCFACGEQNSPEGPEGPSLRNGWECGFCHCC